MKIYGLAGWSGSGKTTLMVRLLPILADQGLRLATIKHSHHKVRLTTPEMESDFAAGAHECLVAGPERFLLVKAFAEETEHGLEDLLARLRDVDLVLIEGFKTYPHPKIEVYRSELGKPLWCLSDPHVAAVATDDPFLPLPVPRLNLNDPAEIARFIVENGRKLL
jgi:molybdopterin-guanine dinucleotide biosynthesis protein B